MYWRLAVTIVADLNVVVAELTVMSTSSRFPEDIYRNMESKHTIYVYMIGALAGSVTRIGQ